MRFSLVSLLGLAATLLVAPPAGAVPRCDHLATRIYDLQVVPTSTPGRIARLQRKYADRCVHLNEVQVLGSHNSYHLLPRPALLQLHGSCQPVRQVRQARSP